MDCECEGRRSKDDGANAKLAAKNEEHDVVVLEEGIQIILDFEGRGSRSRRSVTRDSRIQIDETQSRLLIC
jgi:hypothetical protein